MGLDTSHGCWSGAYSAFSRWRNTIAEVAGYTVKPVEWDKHQVFDSVLIDWGHLASDNIAGIWDKTPDDPLIVLIAHSDCDGEIRPEQAGPLADRLEELLPKVAELVEDSFGHIARDGGYVRVTQRFIDGLREAVAAGEPVEFH